MEGWIKLYRKSKENSLMRDPNAWMIFTWMLLTVDRKTGTMTLGRRWASAYFSMNQSTFYKAIKRLENKYKVISLVTKKVTIKYTEVRVLNWAKYQEKKDEVTTTVTMKEQSSNNEVTHIQEVKNKEVKNYIYAEETSAMVEKQVQDIGKGERIRHEYQFIGLELHEQLKAPKEKKGEFIRIVRDFPKSVVDEAYSFAKDYPVQTIKWKMFFKKLADAKKKYETNKASV